MPSFITVWDIVLPMVLSIVLGFVWYGPMFGKKWAELSGIKMPEEKPGFGVMVKPILLSLLGALFMSFALSSLLEFHNVYYTVSGYLPALSFAFFLWLCFIVPIYLNLAGWEGKPWTLFWINAGYWLVFLVVSAAIVINV